MMKDQIYFKVGTVCYLIQSDEKIHIAEECRAYIVSKEEYIQCGKSGTTIVCDVLRVDQFETISGKLVYQNVERMIFSDEGLERRLHGFQDEVYGIYYELDESHICIEMSKELIPDITLDLVLVEMLALEKYLLCENTLVLHSSYIKWQDEAILFTAPSGTGKSTQADLWAKYEQAEVINGDRSGLHWNEKTQSVEVVGVPFCGSSGINQNQQMPLRAITFIEQAPENHAAKAGAAFAMTKLYQEVSVNRWNQESVLQVMDLIEKIVQAAPMIQLSCNMEQGAVEALKEQLL